MFASYLTPKIYSLNVVCLLLLVFYYTIINLLYFIDRQTRNHSFRLPSKEDTLSDQCNASSKIA